MLERTHAFVPDNFIRHYTLNCYILLINAKVPWKRHELNPILLHVTRTQCNRQENTIKLQNSLL